MEIKEAVAALKEHAKDDVAKALQEDHQSLWQSIHDVGFATANERSKIKIKAAEDGLKDAQTLIEERDKQIQTLEKQTPDLDSERTKHQDVVDKLTKKHGEEVNSLTSKLGESRTKRVRAEIRAKLSNVDNDYAEVQADLAMSRIRFSDNFSEDYEAINENEVAFVPANGKSALDLLIQERLSKIDKRFLKSNVDPGSGNPASLNPSSKDGGLYDGMREKAKQFSGDGERARKDKVGSLFKVND